MACTSALSAALHFAGQAAPAFTLMLTHIVAPLCAQVGAVITLSKASLKPKRDNKARPACADLQLALAVYLCLVCGTEKTRAIHQTLKANLQSCC